MTKNKWYQNGLNFTCTECGKCCTGSPGYVWVNQEEREAIAHFLHISMEEFMQKYVRKVNGRFSLIEKQQSYDCIFLKGKRCQIYGARPTQCRTFPWWPHNLESKEAWERAAQSCEGINEESERVPYEKIEQEHLIQIGRNEKDS